MKHIHGLYYQRNPGGKIPMTMIALHISVTVLRIFSADPAANRNQVCSRFGDSPFQPSEVLNLIPAAYSWHTAPLSYRRFRRGVHPSALARRCIKLSA